MCAGIRTARRVARLTYVGIGHSVSARPRAVSLAAFVALLVLALAAVVLLALGLPVWIAALVTGVPSSS